MVKEFFNRLFNKKSKDNITYRWFFGCKEWRIESKKKDSGLSNLKLFAEDKLEFEGSYGDLIRLIKNKKDNP